MKFLVLAMASAFLLTGCLDKLETLTEQTKNEVTASKDAIHEATDHTGRLNILILLTGYDEPAARRDKAVAAIMAAPVDKIIGIGVPLPLTELMSLSTPETGPLPNVTYVGTESRPNLLITPLRGSIQRELAAAVLVGHVSLLSSAKKYNSMNVQEQAALRTQIHKWALVGAAVMGAKPVPSVDDVDGSRAWPETEEQKKDREAAKALFRERTTGLHNLPGFNNEDRDKLNLLLEVKLDNRYDRLPRP